MKTAGTIRAAAIVAAAMLLCAAAAGAALLSGYYQITGLTITVNDRDTRGYNNTGLYIFASDKRLKVAGAWRGYPVRYDMIIDRVFSDTLFLRDAESPTNAFKFHVRNNVVSGRHSLTDPDNGARQIYDTKATVKPLNQVEVDRLKADYKFLGF